MKRIYSILLAGAALTMVLSCGQRTKKVEFIEPEEDEVESVVQTFNEIKMYSNSYDGFTNVRKGPTTKSEVLGKLRNGNEYVVVLGEADGWLEVQYYDQIGYVHKNYVSATPSQPVTVDVDAKWLEGCWTAHYYSYYLIFSNGRFVLEHQYGTIAYGKWHLEGDQIVLTMTYVTDYGKDFDYRRGQKERLTINKSARRLDSMTKVKMPAELEEGEDGISLATFKYLRKEANKYVRL